MRPRQLSFWLRMCTAVGVLLIVGCTAWLETTAKQQAIQSAADQARTLAKSLAQQASDTFQMADLALISLSRLLGDKAPTRAELQSIEADMSEILLRVPRIRAMAYSEESGWLLASSSPSDAGHNIARSPLFRQLKSAESSALVIAAPVHNDAADRWEIVAGHPIARPDGSFGGILTATIDASYFADFYATFSGTREAHAALMMDDGTVLSRYPFVQSTIGVKVPDSPIFQALWRGEIAGSMRLPSPVTAEDRLQAFSAVAGQPMVVVYTLSMDAVLAPWRADLLFRLPVILCIIGAIISIGLRLARQAERRQVAEAGLVELSRTDPLTGLLNRRDFNEAMPYFWARCRDAKRKLSLLMIDVDCFKLFNDTYGHQAGDTCLQLVSLAVRQCVSPANDRVVRYGGEEIAVILPDASPARANQIAESIRAAIMDLAIQHATSAVSDVITVSIGTATEDWSDLPRLSPGDLINDADRALYQAKIGGRNRMVASGQSDTDLDDQRPSLRLIARN